MIKIVLYETLTDKQGFFALSTEKNYFQKDESISELLNIPYEEYKRRLNNNFIVINKVDGHPLATSQTEITFSHVTENGWVPGITNKQLLAILCERFKEEPKKVEILKALMNS